MPQRTRKLSKADKSSVAVPALSVAALKKMRPAREVLPEIVAAFERKRKGRPTGRHKTVVSISLDKDILVALRASGSGWQTRVNDLVKAAMIMNEATKFAPSARPAPSRSIP